MPERERDYRLIVTVRAYGAVSAENAALALENHPETFEPPFGDGEVEIISVRAADD